MEEQGLGGGDEVQQTVFDRAAGARGHDLADCGVQRPVGAGGGIVELPVGVRI